MHILCLYLWKLGVLNVFYSLYYCCIFHVADETLWGRKVSNFFHFSAITQRPQAGWTQGLRAKRLSARRSVSAYMCMGVCVWAWPLSTFYSLTHPHSLCSLHTKINDKPSWSHLVFLSRLHLIACFPCLLNLIHNPLVPPCWLSPLISLFPLMLSITQSMLSYIWEGHVCYPFWAERFSEAITSVTMHVCKRPTCAHVCE